MMDLDLLKLTKRRAEIARTLDLKSVRDILSYYPFRYEQHVLSAYADFKVKAKVFFVGEVLTAPLTHYYGVNKCLTRLNVLVEDKYEVKLKIYNRPWSKNLPLQAKVVFSGTYEGNDTVTVNNYYLKALKDVLGIFPIYALKGDVTQNEVRKLIDYTLKTVDERQLELQDIPFDLRKKHGLVSFLTAIKEIHHPSSELALKQALARLKYEEFLRFYLAMEINKNQAAASLKKAKHFDEHLLNKLITSLPFTLTADQAQALAEISADLKRPQLMYRLLQGDVGCGKTIVALIALYAVCLSGYQGALMAPTALLARQHYLNFQAYLAPLGIKVVLLTGASKDKKALSDELKAGTIDLVIGTHALFEDNIVFHKLGLTVIDEQQRFGVKQRQKLQSKGKDSDVLLLSATPIPRTLAAAVYGDLAVSTIATLPKGRKGADTYYIRENSLRTIIPQLQAVLAAKEQIYIIAAAIEENTSYNAKAATKLFTALKKLFKTERLALLHGQLSEEEKIRTMNAFKSGTIDILVATTVVEVGVDVKNATCMVIYDAERFGLAQLHQLRGRIQRGDKRGQCFLLSATQEENAIRRLKVLTQTNDGFALSLADLELRGPGDILGIRQSGLPNFILGDILHDTKIITAAQKDAIAVFNNRSYLSYREFYQSVAAIGREITV